MKRLLEILPHLSSKDIPLITTPYLITKIARYAFFAFCVLALLILFLPWQQTVRGYGKVIAYSPNGRAQTIDAPIYGVLGKWHVQDGSVIKKGDMIVELADTDPDLLSRYQNKQAAALARLQATQLSVQMGVKNLERQKILVQEGISSQRQKELAEIELAKYQSEESKAIEELNKIEIKLNRQKMQVVRAPMDGIIQTRLAGLGSQFIKKGAVLAQLIPASSQPAVEIWVDANDLPFLSIDSLVRIQFEGWPAIQSYGWPSLAYGTFGGRISIIDPSVAHDGKIRLLITPDPKDRPWPSNAQLRQGVQSFAWLLLNRVSIGFELWRTLNGFPPFIPEGYQINSDSIKKSKK